MNPQEQELDRLAIIDRFAENFGLDLNSQIEAALASQEADYVIDLATAYAENLAKERVREGRLIELDLLEQALNDGRDLQAYKLQRLEALTEDTND